MDRLRVAVVGMGGKGRQHTSILNSFHDVDIVAVCDPDNTTRSSTAEEFNVESQYETIEELLNNECLNAVFVATPPDLNARTALPCLVRGVNTFLEKPPGMTTAETLALQEASVRTGAKAMVGLNRRFHPSVILAKQMIDLRGPTVQIVGEFHKNMTVLEASTKFEDFVLDNTLAWNNIHSVDLICALAGSPVAKVHSFVRRVLHKNRDVLGALILFENDCVAQLIFNHTSGSRLERYEIHGRDISVYLEGMGGARVGETLNDVGFVLKDNKRENMPEPTTGGTEEEVRYFIDCIMQDNPVGPRTDSALLAPNLDEALKSMKLVDAILEGDIP